MLMSSSRLRKVENRIQAEVVGAANCRDWMGKYEGKSTVALRPKSTEQVSKILAHCNARRLAVVPQVGLLLKGSIYIRGRGIMIAQSF